MMRDNLKQLSGLRLAVLAAALIVAPLVSARPASADAAGSLNEANCSGGGVSISETSITWLPSGTLPGTGCIDTGAGTDVTYSGGSLGAGVTGNIADLTAGSGSVDHFMTFDGSSLDFVLTGFGAPISSTDCVDLTIGSSCSIVPGSPFNLTDLGATTLIGLNAMGTVTDGGTTSLWSGAFSTQVIGTAASIQAALLSGGSVTSTQSAQFSLTTDGSGSGSGGSVPAPEPGTASLLCIGIASLFAIRRSIKIHAA